MFRLVRNLIGLAVVGVLIYAALVVPLGDKTFWQHVRAIAGSEESQDLVEGMRGKAGELFGSKDQRSSPKKLRPEQPKTNADKEPVVEAEPAVKGRPPKPSSEPLTPRERRQLRRMIRKQLDHDGRS